MVGIVKLALRRPYTFIVMALLIMIFGVASALRTPTDIFPSINIPVISVVFSYTGLSPDDMAGRIVTFYERALTTSVNDTICSRPRSAIRKRSPTPRREARASTPSASSAKTPQTGNPQPLSSTKEGGGVGAASVRAFANVKF